MSKLLSLINEVAGHDYYNLPEPIEIKTALPFAVYTFNSLCTDGHTLTMTNNDGEWWHIEEEEDIEVIDVLYNQICEPVNAIT